MKSIGFLTDANNCTIVGWYMKHDIVMDYEDTNNILVVYL
jgi:hypothetical protein